MRLLRMAGIGVGAALLLTLGWRISEPLRTDPNFKTLRLPALDRLEVQSWLDEHRVIAGPRTEPYCSDLYDRRENLFVDVFDPCKTTGAAPLRNVDLESGTSTPLPEPPPLPIDSGKVQYVRSWPRVSPNGRWILYMEQRLEGRLGDLDRTPKRTERWRLIPADGSQARTIPADGSFQPMRRARPLRQDEELGLQHGFHVAWQPDSLGWTLQRRE